MVVAGTGYSGGGGTGGGTGIPGAVCSGQWPGSHRHGDRHYLLFQMCDYTGENGRSRNKTAG